MSEAQDEYHVTIDFQTETPDLTQPYQLIGLETKHPVLRIDRQVYVGTWATNIGTEMMFDEKGDWVMNVEKRLMMAKVEVVRRDEQVEKPTRPVLLRVEDMQESTTEREQRPPDSGLAHKSSRQIEVPHEHDTLADGNSQSVENAIDNDAMDTT